MLNGPDRLKLSASRKTRSTAPVQRLRFTPSAWAKLQWFCHQGPTEIGGFGISAAEDPLLITEFLTVQQQTTVVSVAFDDAAVARYFEEQVERGLQPNRFARIWLHTHPGACPLPSGTDEETFARVFGRCDWAVMFILAQTGPTYCRLRCNVGPGAEALLPVEVDYQQPFGGSDHEAWEVEYDANVQPALHELEVLRNGWSLDDADALLLTAAGEAAMAEWDAQTLDAWEGHDHVEFR